MQTKHLFFILGVSLACLTSCTLYRSNLKHTDRLIDKITANLEQPFKPDEEYKMDTIAVKDDIWLGDQSIRSNEGDPLPARFETDDGITLVSTTPVSLMQISEKITSLTGITVRFDDMILEDVRSTAGAGANAEASDGVQENTDPNLFMPSYSGTLSGLLDQIASRFALWWRYKNGIISFYKMETRVFTIYALPIDSSLTANVSGSGGVGGSASVQLQFWNDLSNTLTSMLNNVGTMNIIAANGTVTVTAPPFTLERITRYINSLNEKLSRQVSISVKVLNVTLTDSTSMGLNIRSVLDFMNKKLNGSKLTLTPTAAAVGQLHLEVLPGDKHIDSMNLYMDALNEQGKTSLVTSASVVTMNNRVAPIQIATDENYVSKSDTTVNSDSTTTSFQTDKITYGFTMDVLPRILDHGRLLLMFNLSLTQLEEMKSVSSNGSMVMLPKVRTRTFTQEIAMVSGATLMLTGFEEVNTSADKQTELFGVTNSAKKNKNVMVVLLSPEVLISPLSPETRMKNL